MKTAKTITEMLALAKRLNEIVADLESRKQAMLNDQLKKAA